jgi:hypothetical protein
MKKHGQVTIFIIVGIIIVSAIGLFFLLSPSVNISSKNLDDPRGYISRCGESATQDALDNIFAGYGYSALDTNYYLYGGENIPYLCKASEFYIPCTPQDPMFVGRIKNEIRDYVTPEIEKCFSGLENGLESTGYNVVVGDMEIVFDLREMGIQINIVKDIAASRDGVSEAYNNYKVEVLSPIMKLGNLAQTIVNFESTLCEFNHVNWMREYPDIKIEKFTGGDQTDVYTLTERTSEKQLKFAIRTCLIPAGI